MADKTTTNGRYEVEVLYADQRRSVLTTFHTLDTAIRHGRTITSTACSYPDPAAIHATVRDIAQTQDERDLTIVTFYRDAAEVLHRADFAESRAQSAIRRRAAIQESEAAYAR